MSVKFVLLFALTSGPRVLSGSSSHDSVPALLVRTYTPSMDSPVPPFQLGFQGLFRFSLSPHPKSLPPLGFCTDRILWFQLARGHSFSHCLVSNFLHSLSRTAHPVTQSPNSALPGEVHVSLVRKDTSSSQCSLLLPPSWRTHQAIQ